jgi:hypothetical protein
MRGSKPRRVCQNPVVRSIQVKKTLYEKVVSVKEVKGEQLPVSIVLLTQETNGFALWRDDVTSAVPALIRFYFDREEAVEEAVALANSDIIKAELAKTAEAAALSGRRVITDPKAECEAQDRLWDPPVQEFKECSTDA